MSDVQSLRALAAGLCHDARLQVAAGEAWAFEPESRTVFVRAGDLAQHGPEVCAGILAHEVGHALVSRYGAFQSMQRRGAFWWWTLNALEDPRVDRFISARYPGAAVWLAAAHGAFATGERAPTRGLEATMAFVEEASHGFRPAELAAPSVRNALEVTRDARRRYAEDTLPPTALEAMPSARRTEVWSRAVAPLLVDRTPPTSREELVQIEALRALRVAEHEVFPALEELWRLDVLDVAVHLAGNRKSAMAMPSRLGDETMVRLFVRGARRRDGAPPAHDPAPYLALAGRVLDAFYQQLNESAAPDRRSLVAGRGGHGPAPDPVAAEATRRVARVAGASELLVRRLDGVLPRRRRLGFRSGYRDGQRLDLRAAQRAEADARLFDRVFRRARLPDRRHTAFLLLVDLSGSMSGRKIDAAIDATFMLAEVLERLSVPFAVYGFQDELIPFCGFHTYAHERGRLLEMADEASGARTGGHNQPGFNDDGPCVHEAAGLLAAEPADDRVMVVLSDGCPAGRRSTDDDLHQALREIARFSPPVRTVGVGVGEGTEHVRRFYRHHRASVPIERLAEVLGDVIGEALTGEAWAR